MNPAEVAFHNVPPALVTEPSATSVLGLAAPTPVLLIAGADSKGRMTITALTDAWVETLWTSAPVPAGADVRKVDLVAAGEGRAIALIPGEALILLEPLADNEKDRTRRIKPGRSRLPARLFATGDTVTGVWPRSSGKPRLATLDPTGARVKDSERFGPALSPGQTVCLILRDATGRDVLIAEDRRSGFHLWRQEAPNEWTCLSTDGAVRYGLNGGISSGVLWGDRVILATDSPPSVRQALPGMLIRTELIALDPDGTLHLLAGEMRTSPGGLMVPEMSAQAITKLDPKRFSHLAVDGLGRLVISASRRNGEQSLVALNPDMTLTVLADPCDPILALIADPDASAQIRAIRML